MEPHFDDPNDSNNCIRRDRKLYYHDFLDSLVLFHENPCESTIYDCYDRICDCLLIGCFMFVPMEAVKDEFKYYLIKYQGSWMYAVCTVTEELEKCGEGIGVEQTLISVIERAARDDTVDGVVFDPYNNTGSCLYCSKVICNKMVDFYYSNKI